MTYHIELKHKKKTGGIQNMTLKEMLELTGADYPKTENELFIIAQACIRYWYRVHEETNKDNPNWKIGSKNAYGNRQMSLADL